MLPKILTKLFGYKYYIVVYHFPGSIGNLEIKARRLIKPDISFIKEILIKRHPQLDKDKILITNIIRVAKIDSDWEF